MIYSEMEYSGRELFEILALGERKGLTYVVVSYGLHPCGYVAIPKGVAINTDDIVCHGGITYTGDKLNGVCLGKDYWWIGWDYAHFGDFSGLIWLEGGRKWTTGEIVEECEYVIDQVERFLPKEKVSANFSATGMDTDGQQ